MSDGKKVVDSDKIWTTLITNTAYLPGLLTLAYSLRRVGSKYPLVALYTDSFPPDGHAALDARGIPKQRVDYLQPAAFDSDPSQLYPNDPRFRDCWTKLVVFSLAQYARIVQLDADMLVVRNMDELMDVELDGEDQLFAACYACRCNPLHLAHYPPSWTPSACDYTHLNPHHQGNTSQTPSPTTTTTTNQELNAGLLVFSPRLTSSIVYPLITTALSIDPSVPHLPFADQSLLNKLFPTRWAALPYIYNALKTMRWRGVHDNLWEDADVKCVHYILERKPWQREMGTTRRYHDDDDDDGHGKGGEMGTGTGKDNIEKGGTEKMELGEGGGGGMNERGDSGTSDDELDGWWWAADGERRKWERGNGIHDGW